MNDDAPAPRPPRPGARGRYLLLGLVLLCLGAIAALALNPRPPDAAGPAAEKPVPVSVQVVAPRPVADVIDLPGRLEPWVDAQLAPEKAGRIVELAADRGDAVRAGQVLMRIDDRAWRALLTRAEIDLREAEKDHARWEKLKEAGAVSGSDYDSVRARLDRARAATD